MIFVDTSVWIDYLRGIDAPHTQLLDRALLAERIATCDIIITELLQGFRRDKEYREARNLLDSLEYYDMLGRVNALQAADNYRLLRKKGVTVRKTLDILIATFCIAHDLPLLHNDRDFDALERHLGLMVVR